MTQVFNEDGTMIPVSVLEITPNTVTRSGPPERDGYTAVQLGAGEARKLTKPVLGQLKDLPRHKTAARVPVRRGQGRRRVRGRPAAGRADVFAAGDLVDVTATSKGKGFAGTVKRHHFNTGPKTHGRTTTGSPGRSAPAPRPAASTRASA
jgi:large subunit ribosomal protein L3